MATRGCTSRAASRDPYAFLVPWTVIAGTLAEAMHRLKLRLKFRGSIGVPCRVIEHQAYFDPHLAGAGTIGGLLALTNFERRDTSQAAAAVPLMSRS